MYSLFYSPFFRTTYNQCQCLKKPCFNRRHDKAKRLLYHHCLAPYILYSSQSTLVRYTLYQAWGIYTRNIQQRVSFDFATDVLTSLVCILVFFEIISSLVWKGCFRSDQRLFCVYRRVSLIGNFFRSGFIHICFTVRFSNLKG